MAGLTVPLIDKALLAAVTTGTSPGVDVAGCAALSFAVVGNGALGAGAVALEESHDKDYTGTWVALTGSPVTALPNGVAIVKVNTTCKAVRARVTTGVTGGTVSVILTGR